MDMSWANEDKIWWNGEYIERGNQSVVFFDFVLLTDCVAPAVEGGAPEWKEAVLTFLKSVKSLENVGFIPVIPRAYGYTRDVLNELLQDQHIRVERLLEADDAAERAKVIEEYIEYHQIFSYAVIDREDFPVLASDQKNKFL